MPEVGILIIDDDVTSQQALKLILDSEGWRVRIVPSSSQAMGELATGNWDLAIVNVALLDTTGPLFGTLTELAQAQALVPDSAASTAAESQHQQQRKRFRALFLVPLMGSKEVPLLLERLGLPYSFTPYHLHDFLEKVSELLVESGAIPESLRSVSGFETKKRRGLRSSRDAHTSKKMFASREDYQMTEEEMADYERQEKEEEERKKRAKQLLNRQRPPGPPRTLSSRDIQSFAAAIPAKSPPLLLLRTCDSLRRCGAARLLFPVILSEAKNPPRPGK